MEKIVLQKKATIIVFLFLVITMRAQNINTFAGNGSAGNTGDGGQATMASISEPFGIATDILGNIYITDIENNNIRQVNSEGIITTIAGTGVAGFSGDGGLASLAQLNLPMDVVIDGADNIYICDFYNLRIRKIAASGTISTIAGNGSYGFSGDGGLATSAELGACFGIAIDNSGNIYFSDENRIRKINTSGIISTIAGNGIGGFSGDDGLATLAQINLPTGIVVSGAGDIIFADQENNRIRKINTAGIITTIAGTGVAGFSGDGGLATSAELNLPNGVAIDALGDLLITDNSNNSIRKVSTSGNISTIAGNGIANYYGDGGLAALSQMNSPRGIDVDAQGNIYIGDQGNSRVRVICSNNCFVGLNEITNTDVSYSIYPNPTNASFKLKIDNEFNKGQIIMINYIGQKIHEQEIHQGINQINTYDWAKGIYYFSILQDNLPSLNGKLLVE